MEIEEAIMKHVLRFVPAKSLMRFKSVSKNWYNWISSPFFAHQQATHFTKTSGFVSQSNHRLFPFFIPLHHHSHGVPSPTASFFLPESSTVRSTSHGLLCCKSTFQENTYFIANPTTEQWIKLPEPTLFHSPATAFALAFTPSTYNFYSHFQLVCAVPFDSVNAVYFEIYSSRTNSWRLADSQYCYHGNDLKFKGDGFFMDGSVYWEMSSGVVLGFDLKYEEHGEILLPHLPLAIHGALMEMNGELCYVMVVTMKKNEDDNDDNNEDDDYYYGLGVYGGGGHEMVLKRRIPLHDYNGDILKRGEFEGDVRVLSCLSEGVVMILVGSNVTMYHVEERKGKLIVGNIDPTELSAISVDDGVVQFLPYVNTLVTVCPVEEMPPEDRQFDEIFGLDI